MADISFIGYNVKDEVSRNPPDLLEMKQRLENELHQLEIAKRAGDQVVDETDEDKLISRISELSEELLEESTNVSWKNLLIKRVQSASEDVLKNAHSSEDNLLIKSCQAKLELASEIMRIYKDILDLEKTYASEKLVNLDLKQNNMALVQRLKDHKAEVRSISDEVKRHPDYKKLTAKLNVKSKSVEINKNLITQIVVGAGMDWDTNPNLRKIILNEENI